MKRFEELLTRYWELAYHEGRTGAEQGDEANAVLHELRQFANPAQRKPLTDEEIHKASTQAGMQEHYMGFHSGFVRFARAIEAAHGITKE